MSLFHLKNSLGLTFFASLVYLDFGEAPAHLIYEQTAVGQGEIWRIFTAQWVHSSNSHWFWNTLALFLISAALSPFFAKQILSMLFSGFLGVAFYLYYIADLDYYCGLSGALIGLLVAGLLKLSLSSKWRYTALLTLFGLGLKMSIEATTQAIFVESQWGVVPLAHFYGALGGVGYFILEQLKTPSFKNTEIGEKNEI